MSQTMQASAKLPLEGLRTDIVAGRHALVADEPAPLGSDAGPTPYDLLAAALAACTAMTLRMYTQRRKLQTGPLSVHVGHARVHAQDCVDCERPDSMIERFERRIDAPQVTDPALRAKLLEIAEKCPVHRTLSGTIRIVTEVVPG